MCIVSIYSKSNGDLILTQNRDESILRPTSDEIQERELFGQNYVGPLDLVSGGTWLYYTEQYFVCILNGGYVKHSHLPPYRKSRGLVVLDFLKYNSIDEFYENVYLDEIEPFTMILIHRFNEEKKIIVWDGTEKYLEDHSNENLIVRSSSTLYETIEKEEHKLIFENLNEIDPDLIYKLHFGTRMMKNERFPTVQTTSISQLVQIGNQVELKFCPISE